MSPQKTNRPKVIKKNARVADQIADLDSRLLYLERHDECHIKELTDARIHREKCSNDIDELREGFNEIRSVLSEEINAALVADCEDSQ